MQDKILQKKRRALAIILAAGEGTRMYSSIPKVLHKVAGLSLLGHILNVLKQTDCDECAVITGRGAQAVEEESKRHFPNVQFFYQKERLGTAHAVLAAKEVLQQEFDDILLLFGDTPLIEVNFLEKARAELAQGADLVVSGFYTEQPTGYGRLLQEEGQLIAIIEEKDATPAQKAIQFCNGGIMALSGKKALSLLEQIHNHNSQKEFYLTELVEIAYKQNLRITTVEVPFESILGVNTKCDLMKAEQLWQQRKRKGLLLQGVTMLDAASVYFSYDTKIENDVIIEPHVYFKEGVHIKQGSYIRAFSYIEQSIIGPFAEIGPFARVRPKSLVKEKAKIGNFCEVKNSVIEQKAKINHLSYIGDSLVKEGANIGAGTITCNYDGFSKWTTEIGKNAFIGSNSALIAPVKIGNNAYIASGSVITTNVPENALALARSRQVTKLDYAPRIRNKIIRQAKCEKDNQ